MTRQLQNEDFMQKKYRRLCTLRMSNFSFNKNCDLEIRANPVKFSIMLSFRI